MVKLKNYVIKYLCKIKLKIKRYLTTERERGRKKEEGKSGENP